MAWAGHCALATAHNKLMHRDAGKLLPALPIRTAAPGIVVLQKDRPFRNSPADTAEHRAFT